MRICNLQMCKDRGYCGTNGSADNILATKSQDRGCKFNKIIWPPSLSFDYKKSFLLAAPRDIAKFNVFNNIKCYYANKLIFTFQGTVYNHKVIKQSKLIYKNTTKIYNISHQETCFQTTIYFVGLNQERLKEGLTERKKQTHTHMCVYIYMYYETYIFYFLFYFICPPDISPSNFKCLLFSPTILPSCILCKWRNQAAFQNEVEASNLSLVPTGSRALLSHQFLAETSSWPLSFCSTQDRKNNNVALCFPPPIII